MWFHGWEPISLIKVIKLVLKVFYTRAVNLYHTHRADNGHRCWPTKHCVVLVVVYLFVLVRGFYSVNFNSNITFLFNGDFHWDDYVIWDASFVHLLSGHFSPGTAVHCSLTVMSISWSSWGQAWILPIVISLESGSDNQVWTWTESVNSFRLHL